MKTSRAVSKGAINKDRTTYSTIGFSPRVYSKLLNLSYTLKGRNRRISIATIVNASVEIASVNIDQLQQTIERNLQQ